MPKALRTLFIGLILLSGPAAAVGDAAVAKAIEDYMDFTEYGSSLIWPEQIPEADWNKIKVIDARDAAQFAKGHIPGAVNIEPRKSS